MAFPPNSVKNDPKPEQEDFSVCGARSRIDEEQPQLAHRRPVAEVRDGSAKRMARAVLVTSMAE